MQRFRRRKFLMLIKDYWIRSKNVSIVTFASHFNLAAVKLANAENYFAATSGVAEIRRRRQRRQIQLLSPYLFFHFGLSCRSCCFRENAAEKPSARFLEIELKIDPAARHPGSHYGRRTFGVSRAVPQKSPHSKSFNLIIKTSVKRPSFRSLVRSSEF